VIDALRGLDPVAYVRFASVYRDFREAADFESVLGEIARNALPNGDNKVNGAKSAGGGAETEKARSTELKTPNAKSSDETH
jgi:hypothetical protein